MHESFKNYENKIYSVKPAIYFSTDSNNHVENYFMSKGYILFNEQSKGPIKYLKN